MTNFLTDPITTPTTPLLRRRGLHIMEEIKVFVADERHIKYVDTILDTIERAAKIRGTGIAKRSPEYVKQKMLERKAIIALDGDKFAGFCYIESWSNKQVVANSGTRFSQKNQAQGFRVIPRTISGSQDIWVNDRRSSHENK